MKIEQAINGAPNIIQKIKSELGIYQYPKRIEKEESKTECERNLIYEKDTESIIQLVSDGRSLKSGGLDVNQVLRSPASYGGDIKTIKLSSIFSGQAQFDSVIARYNKDGKLVVEVVFAGKKNKVIMDAPSPY